MRWRSKIRPDYAEAHNNLGATLIGTPGRAAEAIAHFEAALRIHPGLRGRNYNLGGALRGILRPNAEAIAHLEAAQRLRPDPELARTIQRLKSGK